MYAVRPYRKNHFFMPESAKFHIFSFLDKTGPLEKVSRQFKKYHEDFLFDLVYGKHYAVQRFGKVALEAKTVNTTWIQVYDICSRCQTSRSPVRLPLYTISERYENKVRFPYIPADFSDSDSDVSYYDPSTIHDSSEEEPS